MTTDIAIQEEAGLLALPSARQGNEIVHRSMAASQSLADAVLKNGWFTPMGDKKYLEVEAWQFIGMVIGINSDIEYTNPITDDSGSVVAYESKAVLYQHGVPFSSGIMECGMNSFPTRGKNGRDKDKAAQSASQTWAISKAYRNRLGYLAKMAGYEATPADEMRWDGNTQIQGAAPVATPPPPPRPQAPAPPPQPVVSAPALEPCLIHNVEWTLRPTPAGWSKTPEGRPFNTASHKMSDGSGYCNLSEVYKAELGLYLGTDRDINDATREWLNTTWSRLDPEQMIEVVALEHNRFKEQDDTIGINILSIDEVADGGLQPLFNEHGEELPQPDNQIPEEDQPF